MQKEVFKISVGKSYPSTLTHNGPVLKFSKSGITILNVVPNPNDYEVNAASNPKHQMKIGYLSYGRIGLLIFDFKEYSFEVPFDAGIEKLEDIPDLTLLSDSSRLLLAIISIDSSNLNKVYGIRIITASPRVTKYISQKILMQKTQPIGVESYSRLVDELYINYPTYKSVTKSALAFDKAGCDE